MKKAEESIGKYSIGFGLSFAAASLFSALLVVLKETTGVVKAWMNAALGHHWITHGILTLMLFTVGGLVLSSIRVKDKLNGEKMQVAIIAAAIASGAIVAGLFLTRI